MAGKAQELRRARYMAALHQCGFRSWKRANARRADLCYKKTYVSLSADERAEFAALQKLSSLYVKWKTNDATGRAIRRLQRLQKKYFA